MGDPVARCCIMPLEDDRYLMASDGIRLAIDQTKYEINFVAHQINYDIFRKCALEVSNGSTRKRIGLDDLRKLSFCKPCLGEQKKIGEFLRLLDTKLVASRSTIDNTIYFKQGILQQMFV